ncbi:hypothetical protein K505DRAFT_267501 [Melanomma pulvis-pyrius CBS 109.77]|uniref:PEBP-like protein n=1 Tax=Melanomma pulvis-pyrius CBS 109.77 TaxID=1314802 RepID=A0A6A6XQ71_9PLEO|nr:hypothetical protein K505DRAFT_267501 [Melanomma pulvis-pyrius CBS 109.77]
MLFNSLRHAALAATFFGFSAAQDTVPSDLAVAFGPSGTELQVSYTNNAVDGFDDGTTFKKAEVTKEPTFALGDSSGIVPKARYTVVLVDTTTDDARTLHYARSNFKLTGEIVNIASDSDPSLAYQAPGAFKETGTERKYSFLLYQHFANKEVTDLKLPEEGAVFTVKQFQDDNGFDDPVGGVLMVVNLGAGGGGDQAPASSAAQGQASTTSVQEVSSSTAAEEVASSTTAVSSVRASSVVTRISSAIVSSATDDSQAPETTAEAPETTRATPQTSGLAAASSVLQSAPGPSTSTIFLAPGTTGTPTGTGAPTQQTDSGASDMALGTASCAVGAAMVVFAGLLAW